MHIHSLRLLTAPLLLLIILGIAPPRAHAAPPSRALQQQLLHAVVQDQAAAVQALLQRGADPNARATPAEEDAWALENRSDDDPAPPLIVLACRFGSIEGPRVIQLLLEKGAKVNSADCNGVTPLMAAAELGMDSVRLLLEHGAKINVKDRAGKTPLMYAMNNRGLNTVALLLEKGADINARDASGWTPLMFAIRRAAYDPVRLIGEDPIKKAREEKAAYAELIRFLLAKGAAVNLKDSAGNTPLKLAASQRRPDIVQMLRKAGARE
jgi:ankyrin repeat protein